jgi:hypothetical protein
MGFQGWGDFWGAEGETTVEGRESHITGPVLDFHVGE